MPPDADGERTELAGGKLLLDHPAEAVARLTISNPERRNALDHEILDALAETMPKLDRGHRDPLRGHHRRRRRLLGRLRHRRDPGRDASSATPRRSSPIRSTPRWRRSARIPTPCSPRSTATASAAGSSWRSAATCASARWAPSSACRPAKLGLIYGHTGLQKFIDVDRRRPHQGALPHRPQPQRARGRGDRPRQRHRPRRRARRRRRSALAAEIAANAPLSHARQQARDRDAQLATRASPPSRSAS